jgi:hypothetical protein
LVQAVVVLVVLLNQMVILTTNGLVAVEAEAVVVV